MKTKNVQRRDAARNVRDARPQRERVALYLTPTESEKLKAMRLAVVTAGLKLSDNSLVLAALRALNLQDPEFIDCYKAVQSDDRRRKG